MRRMLAERDPFPAPKMATAIALFAAIACGGAAQAEPWWPVSVESRQPAFKDDASFVRMEYTPMGAASRPWRLCASAPTLATEYFQAVVEGMRREAERKGVPLTLQVGDGLDPVRQAQQLSACLDEGAQALLIVAAAQQAFNGVLARAEVEGVIVIDLATGLGSPNVTARIVPDSEGVGRAAGTFLAQKFPPGGDRGSVVWAPGPPSIEFAAGYDVGFREALESSALDIVASEPVPADPSRLDSVVKSLLDEAPEADAMAGIGAAVQSADKQLGPRATEMTLVATGIGAQVVESIEAGRVDAAVNAMPVYQGRIAVDLAVRALEGLPYMADLRPTLEIVDGGNVKTFDRRGAILTSP